MAEPKDPFVVNGASGIGAALDEGMLLWESLKSMEGMGAFFTALETLDASELRKVLVAARTESVKTAFGCR